MNTKSFILVLIQFFCIFSLAQNATNLYHSTYAFLFALFGGILLLSAIWEMRKSTYQILPDVSSKAKLIKTGPYAVIRHPMYTGLLFVCLGLLITNVTVQGVVLFMLLLFDIFLKLTYEEDMLNTHFPEYQTYAKKTKKLLPYIY